MPSEKPLRLKRPWPQARSARSLFARRPAGFLDVDGVAASGILTLTAEPAADETVVIEGKTYTFKGVAATETLTLTGQPLDLETVTIDGKVYTFDDTTLDDVDGHVLIGGSASDSLDNLIAAITLGAGAGTVYATSTTLHPTVTAEAGAGTTMDATAKAKGTAGNSIATIEGLTNGSWGDTTMSGGLSLTDTDGFVFIGDTGADGAIDNLVAAITLGAGSGTAYAASTTLHSTVTAAAGAGDTMDATAKDEGVAGNALTTTETLGAGSWAAATLLGGVDPDDAVTFVPVVQWSSIRVRLRITGSAGTIGLAFVRPAREIDPNTDGLSFVYTVDQPSVNGTSWADGTELSLEISATEHQGENWLKVTLSPTDDGAVLDFLDISGVNVGQGS